MLSHINILALSLRTCLHLGQSAAIMAVGMQSLFKLSTAATTLRVWPGVRM